VKTLELLRICCILLEIFRHMRLNMFYSVSQFTNFTKGFYTFEMEHDFSVHA
jgi:hypothetical protein